MVIYGDIVIHVKAEFPVICNNKDNTGEVIKLFYVYFIMVLPICVNEALSKALSI